MIRPSSSGLLALVFVCFATVPVGVQSAHAQGTDLEKLRDTAEWRKTMQDLEEWSSVQKIYDKDQLAKLKQQLEQKVKGMSADQLTAFLRDLKQKLAILNSGEARQAHTWLDETLAAVTPAYGKKILDKLPDVAHLTAAQLQQQLDKFQDERAAERKYVADSAKIRQEQVKGVNEERARADKAIAAAQAAAPPSPYNFNQASRDNHLLDYGRWQSAYPRLYGGYRW